MTKPITSSQALERVSEQMHPGGKPMDAAIRLAKNMTYEDGILATNAAFRNIEDRLCRLEALHHPKART